MAAKATIFCCYRRKHKKFLYRYSYDISLSKEI